MKRGTVPFARKGMKWKRDAITTGMITSGALTWLMLCIGKEKLMSIFAIITLLLVLIGDIKRGKEGSRGE